MSKKKLAAAALGGIGAATILAYLLGLAHAAGIPTMAPVMTYSGTLSDAAGIPLTGSKNIQLQIWDQAGTSPVCLTPSSAQTLVAGNFQIPLPDTCTGAVRANPDLWVEILVDGASLGRSKLGAVPYAIEAASASAAAGALDTRLTTLMPPKTVVNAYLTGPEVTSGFDSTGLGKTPGPYAGWAICNGNNGTPNLANRFVRASAAASGATGGSDSIPAHSHSIDHDHPGFASATEAGHTHSTPAHAHTVPIGVDSNNFFWAVDAGDAPLYGSTVINVRRTPPATGGTANFGTGLARLAYTDSSGAGTTGAGSAHSHSIDPPAFTGSSSAAPTVENRPAYFELVALMRL